MSTTPAGDQAALDPAAVDAAPGPEWCAAWSEVVDRALVGNLAADAAELAVVALGSYGRRELCPGSDIDLVLVHDGTAADLDGLVRALCYPLWDARLEVGHAVWTPREAVEAADADTVTATSLLSRRFVAGNRALADELDARLREWQRDAGARLVAALSAHADTGTVGRLEPDLKTDPGGLRSLHRLDWAASCLLGERDLAALAGPRYFTAGVHATLVTSADTLLAVRCALHQTEGRAGDRLRIDLHDDVAARLGLDDGETLLRRVGLAMRAIAHAHDRAWPRLRLDAAGNRADPAPRQLDDGVWLVDELVEIDADRDPVAEPSLGFRAVAAAAGSGARLGGASAEWLRHRLDGQTLSWDAAAREALLVTLRAGPRAPAALADADDSGVLTAMLPGWSRVRGRPQRNPFHAYDLDTHLAQTVRWLARVAAGELDDEHAVCWRGLEDADALWLGAWLHDCGKAWPGDHSVVGADVADGWMRHMGFGAERAHRVATLARHHLLLADTATRRDLDEPREIGRVADAVGDTEMLDALWLLSLADARASGPATHSPWKDALLATLRRRVRAWLQDDAVTPGRPEETATEARQAALAADATLEPLLAGMPQRYFVVASTRQILAHAELLAARGQAPLVCAWHDGEVAGTAVLSVVAADRRGLLADCAGVLAGVGFDLLDARAVTRDDGLAVDWFTVTGDDVGDRERAAAALRDAATGRGDVAGLVEARERRRDARLPREAALADHAVALDEDGEQVRIEVTAPNTPGLAYRLTRAAADAGWSIAGLKAESLGAQARVVFFLGDVGGEAGAELARLLGAEANPPAHLRVGRDPGPTAPRP